MLIISDRAANVARLEKLIATIDQTGDREVVLIKLENASAAEVVRTINSLQQQDKQPEAGAKQNLVIADERTNSVLIGGDKNDRDKLVDIIKKLDTPLSDDGATQVVYLRYADAENLAPILEGFAAQQGKSDAKGAAAAAQAASGGDKPFRIIAEPDTNALVITAPPKTMRALRNVIGQLDIKRAQVLVETVIAEVSATKSSQLGVDFAAYNPNRVAAASILDPGTLSAAQAAGAALLGSSSSTSASSLSGLGGLLGQGLTAAAGSISSGGTSFALLLKALAGDGNTNVLSTPSIVTMDNEEAEISVGQEVPFLTGSFSNTGTGSTSGSVNPFQTIQRKDVGLTLGITPQINEGDTVTLQLDLEVSSLSSGSAGASDLITNKRTITNTVSVESGQILVLGGLIDDNLQESERGIPFLRSIPFIGSLFSSRSVNKQKRNLMVFIHPVILRGPTEMDYYTNKKYDSIRSSQIEAAKGPVRLIGGQRPVLEAFDKREKDLKPTPTESTAPPSDQNAVGPAVSTIVTPPPANEAPASQSTAAEGAVDAIAPVESGPTTEAAP
jgi:general secretion pathway protein D